MTAHRSIRVALLAGAVTVALAAPAPSLGAGASTSSPQAATAPDSSTNAPAPEATQTSAAPATEPSTPGTTEVLATPVVPDRRKAHSRRGVTSPPAPPSSSAPRKRAGGKQRRASAKPKPSGPQAKRAKHRAPSPSALTPPLPLDFSAPLAGVPGFFIESFRIPPFLLPIH